MVEFLHYRLAIWRDSMKDLDGFQIMYIVLTRAQSVCSRWI